MAEELFIPKLGQTVEEVTLVNWLVKDGDKVEQGQEVLEVETDKAVFNVEAVDKGYIHIGPFKEGDVVPVLTVVAVIGKQDDKFEAKAAQPEKAAEPAEEDSSQHVQTPKQSLPSEPKADREKIFVSPRAKKLAAEKHITLDLVKPTGGKGLRIREQDVIDYLGSEPKVSPVAKVMAEKAGLDLRSIAPSGPRGEITRADVERALAQRSEAVMPEEPAITQLPLAEVEIRERVPLIGVRGVIAERMGLSARVTSRVTLFMDVDATSLVDLRERWKADFEKAWGFAPGYNDILARLCATALFEFPYMNARLNGDVIERLVAVNIGIAVDADKGLYVPVIREADRKNLRTIGAEFRQRVEEIRSSKISPDHLTGGTFTITNLGMYDVEGFTPVINLPEAAILGVGKIIPKPVVRAGQVVIRQMLTLSLAFDHRLVDGAPAARFMQRLKQYLEIPDEKQILG